MAFEHNDIVTVNRMNEAIAEGGGGGGGTTEPLICTYGADDHIDTTFGDILEAYIGGRPVLLHDSQGDNVQMYFTLENIRYSREDHDGTMKWSASIAFYSNNLVTSLYDTFEDLLGDYPAYSE